MGETIGVLFGLVFFAGAVYLPIGVYRHMKKKGQRQLETVKSTETYLASKGFNVTKRLTVVDYISQKQIQRQVLILPPVFI